MASNAIPEGYETVTVNTHNFDPETVRFLLISYEPPDMIKYLTDWEIKILHISDQDYNTPETIQTAVWVVAEQQDLIMFYLKYKNNVILEVTQGKMNQIMRYARARVDKKRRTGNVVPADYMDVLTRVAPVERAINNFLSDALTPWYQYYV